MTARDNPLPPAVSGERRDLPSSSGRLSYYVSGPTSTAHAPLLLVHSVNAAASAYEVRPLYEHYRTHRSVYALELPGFGFSDRSEREYTPRLMTDAIDAMVGEIARLHGSAPIDALALSLSCEFLARAASEQPAPYRSLALVSPTGFSGAAPKNGPPGSTRGMPWLRGFFTFPLWSRPFFDLLTSRRSIRFFLEKTWGSKTIDEGLAEYDWRTARQSGAHHAPYYFVSGFLFSNDISRVYQSLALPVFMVHGVRGDFVDYRQKQRFEAKPNWTIRVSPTGALPHFEMLEAFTRDYDKFLAEAGGNRSG
jgi:pimeloyl-ACP methyl ester carboxylesterase